MMKKTILILAGIVVLASGGYVAGKMLTKKNNKDNFVQLEDGRRVKINNASNGEFDKKGEKPDATGKVKSINDEQMVIEKFEISNRGAGRAESPVSDEEKATVPTEKSEPSITGEETITFSANTSFVKGQERGTRRNGGDNSKIEEISKDELAEGSIVSVWFSDDKVAQKVMMR